MTDIFEDRTGMPRDPGKREEFSTYAMPMERQAAPLVVRTAQTTAEQRQLSDANYPRYDWPGVRNLKRPRFGYDY